MSDELSERILSFFETFTLSNPEFYGENATSQRFIIQDRITRSIRKICVEAVQRGYYALTLSSIELNCNSNGPTNQYTIRIDLYVRPWLGALRIHPAILEDYYRRVTERLVVEIRQYDRQINERFSNSQVETGTAKLTGELESEKRRANKVQQYKIKRRPKSCSNTNC